MVCKNYQKISRDAEIYISGYVREMEKCNFKLFRRNNKSGNGKKNCNGGSLARGRAAQYETLESLDIIFSDEWKEVMCRKWDFFLQIYVSKLEQIPVQCTVVSKNWIMSEWRENKCVFLVQTYGRRCNRNFERMALPNSLQNLTFGDDFN